MTKDKLKHGSVIYEDHFMEIRHESKHDEEFVALVSEKIEQDWKLVNASTGGN